MSVNQLFRTDPSSGMLMCHLTVLGTSNVPQHYVDMMKLQKLNQNAYGGYQLIPTGSLQECLASISDIGDGNWLGRTSDEDYMLVVPCCEVGPAGDYNFHLSVDTRYTKLGYLRLQHYHMQVRVKRKSEAAIDMNNPKKEKDSAQVKHVASCPFAKTFGTFVSDNKAGAQGIYFTFMTSKQAWQNIYGERYTRPMMISLDTRIQGPAVTVNRTFSQWNVCHVDQHDLALALKCVYWPDVANEWRIRARPSGWPSPGLIDDVVKKGFHVVSTAHLWSERRDIEWRFSFTVAEKTLALSLTKSQRNCYILFKTVISHWFKPHTVISSYCLKNILFWTLEMIPSSVWENDTKGKGICFSALLDQLIHCLADRHLPHYFIPGNNLIECKPPEQIRDVLKLLVRLRNQYFIPFFVTVDSGLAYVVKVMEFNNLINHTIKLDTMLFAEASAEEIQELLCESRLFECVADHVVFPNYFAEVVNDLREFVPGYFEKYESDSNMLMGKVGSQEFTQHAYGFGWCMFVYDCVECHDSPYFGFALIESLFKAAANHAGEQSLETIAELYYAMFLRGRDRFAEALSKLENILLGLDNDATMQREKYVIRMCDYEARIVSEPMQRAMMSTFKWVHVKTLVHHLLLHIYHKQNHTDKVESLIPAFIQHTEHLKDDPYIFADDVFRSGLNILGHDLQYFGFHEDAIRIYLLHQEHTGSNPGIAVTTLEEVDKCLHECEKQVAKNITKS